MFYRELLLIRLFCFDLIDVIILVLLQKQIPKQQTSKATVDACSNPAERQENKKINSIVNESKEFKCRKL